jgi:hypothetical protein
MINKNNTKASVEGALSTKEKEDLLFDSFGALRSEIHSLAKQISFIQTLEKNILVLLLCSLIVVGIVGVFVAI